jgi:hypothetical protein
MSKTKIGRPVAQMLKGRSGESMADGSQRSRSPFKGREHSRKVSVR